MTSGKHRKRKNKKRKTDFSREPIVNASPQQPNPQEVTTTRADAPQPPRQQRPPSTLGEIWIAIFVAITAAIYIGLTYISTETLHVDQRAWVSADIGEKDGHFSVAMHNSGKTPALNATYVMALTPGKAVSVPDVDLSHDSSTPVEVPKNLPSDMLERLKQEGFIPTHPPGGFIIAPGKSEISSSFSSPFAQTFGTNDPRNRMYIQGRFTYDDIFEKKHETTFCYWYAAPNQFPMCNDHNKMD